MGGLILHRPSVIALSGAAAAMASLLVLLLPTPAPEPSSQVRQASLHPRSPWTSAPRWAFVIPVVATVLVTAAAWVMAALAGRLPDGDWGYGYQRVVGATIEPGKPAEIFREAAFAGPWLGWTGAVLVTLAAAGVLLLLFVVVSRIATDPNLGEAGLAAADERVRAVRTRMAVMATSAWLIAQCALLVLLPGVALSGLEELDPQATEFVLTPLQPQVAIGQGLVRGSGAFALLAIALAIMAASAIVRLRRNG